MRFWVLAAMVIFAASTPQAAHAAWLFQPSVESDQTTYSSWSELRRSPESLSIQERKTIQPDYTYHALFTPNDPQFPQQWNLPLIQAPGAWDSDITDPTFGGDPAVLVAVLDTGLAYENYLSYIASNEIAGQVWTNSGEIADGIDNDLNGFVDDIHGWDFVNSDNHPNDDHGHGTHIAGTIAGLTNNSIGVAGIAWHSTILPLKVLDAGGNGTTSTIASAINYAVQAGADIINLSLGGNNDDPILHQTIQAAISRGVVIVAATGNDGASQLNYPARYSEVIAVGAITSSSQVAPYSNTGTNIDVVAPGGAVDADPWQGIVQESCRAINDCSVMALVSYTGTSQAAAHVAGAAALLLACGVPGGSIASTLSSSATDVGPVGYDTSYGAGVINIQSAMTLGGCGLPPPTAPSNISVVSSSTTTRQLTSRLPVPYTNPVFSWTGQAGAVYQVSWGKQTDVATTSTQTATTFTPTLISQGLYQFTVRTIDALSRTSDAQTFLYRFRRPSIVLSRGGTTSQVSLFTPSGEIIRTWSAGLGSIVPMVAGTSTDRQSARLLITGEKAGTGIRVVSTKGVRQAFWRPFGTSIDGGVQATGIRRFGKETLVASTASSRGATIRWTTLSGDRILSVKAFSNHTQGLTLTSADLDGDGNDEVIVAKNSGSFLTAFDTAGKRLWQTQPLGKSWRGAWSLTRFDSNNDGRDEIAVGGLRTDGTTKIVLINELGKQSASWTLRSSNGNGLVDLTAVDVNGNGTEELISMTRSGSGVINVWSPTGKRSSAITLNRAKNDYRLTVLQ